MNKSVQTFNLDSSKYHESRPRYPNELYSLLANHCSSFSKAWDCACGSGQVAIDLAPYFNEIHATDINENQITNAYLHDKIIYSTQNSENTNFESDSFDLICAAQCIHWFNPKVFFNEIKRVQKRDGVFSFWGYSFFSIEPKIDLLVKTNFLDIIDPYWSDNNRILHNGYTDIELPFKNITKPSVNMIMQWNFHQLLDYLSTWSAVKLYNEASNTEIINDLKNILIKEKYSLDKVYDVKMDFFCTICDDR